jgi:hypothetical protein
MAIRIKKLVPYLNTTLVVGRISEGRVYGTKLASNNQTAALTRAAV